MNNNVEQPSPSIGMERYGSGPWSLNIIKSFADWCDRYATYLFIGLAGLILLSCAVLAYFLTVEPDEAWILLSTARAFGLQVPVTSALDNPTVTSGGIHLLVHGIVASISPSIGLHRAVSLASAAALLGLCWHIFRRFGSDRPAAALGTAAFAAVPGLAFQASLAMAEIIAVPLMLLACVHWTLAGRKSVRAALLSGVIAGLACATRINCVILLPALMFTAFLAETGILRRIVLPLICISVATAVMLLLIGVYVYAGGTTNIELLNEYLTRSTGVGSGLKPLGNLLLFLMVADRFLSFVIISMIIIGFCYNLRNRSADLNYFTGLLIMAGLFGIAAWVLKAPIPHIRYIWPSICVLWVAGILLILHALSGRSQPYIRLIVQGGVAVACVMQIVRIVPSILDGDSLTQIYQIEGSSPFVITPHKLQASHDEVAMAAALEHLPIDAQLYTPTEPAGYPLTYLSGRTIFDIQRFGGTGNQPAYLLIVPSNLSTWRPDEQFVLWIQRWCRPVQAVGGYHLLKIDSNAPRSRFQTVWIGQGGL